MHQYEVMVILDPSVEEKTVEPSIDKFLNVIRTAKGTITVFPFGEDVALPTKSKSRPKVFTRSLT